jgi:DNA ligase-1
MRDFATLLDRLAFAPQRSAKLRLLQSHFSTTADPDRGWALAALTDGLSFPHVKPGLLRQLIARRADPLLFALSYDFVGDLAETVALMWPAPAPTGGDGAPASLAHVVETLMGTERTAVPALIEGWLDAMPPGDRYALLKLITGALRVGVSARLAKTALAGMGDVPVDRIEELWHGLEPPYAPLFAWLEGKAPPPAAGDGLGFRPLMLATPLSEAELPRLDASDFLAEWKWDGIRVQLSADGRGGAAIYSRTGDDISPAFPDIARHLTFDAVLDGELLVARDGVIQPFNALQQRLNRKLPAKTVLSRFPAWVRLYDILFENGSDLRPLPLAQRRARLECWFARSRPPAMDISALLPFRDWEELTALRAGARAEGIEGVMLKRRDSPYLAGRPKGPWFKWKRDPLSADCVLMYAQRGHGKRSSFYSDYTFGCWRDESGTAELVPVGKAYFGFTDDELVQLDRWVRSHTVERFGPVRAVEPGLVLEIAFDALQPSARHKSGIAMRFPRVARIRWDKPAHEADRLATLQSLLSCG